MENTASQFKLELKLDAVPYHAWPYPIPQSREDTTRKQIERLCSIGVLKSVMTLNGEHLPLSYQKGTVRYALYWTSVSWISDSSVNHSASKNSRSHAKARGLSVCDIFRLQYGILPYWTKFISTRNVHYCPTVAIPLQRVTHGGG